MTIVFFARRFYPLIGGVEKHVMEVGKRLAKGGHRVIVVTENSEALIGNETRIVNRLRKTSDAKRNGHRNRQTLNEIINGIEIIRISVDGEDWFKKFRIWSALWNLRDVIKNADVIHCHDVFFWYLPFRFLYPRKSVYTTFHGYESYPIKKSAIIVRKISEKLSSGNICIGDFISKWYGTKPDYVSYGAVEFGEASYGNETRIVNRLRKTSDAKRNGHRNRLTNDEAVRKDSALFFGRLDEQTGVLAYVKAFEILKKKLPKFELLVIGDGEYKKKIEKKVKGKLQKLSV